MEELYIGDTVRAHYNSGIYIGKVVEDRGKKFLIEVLAVAKHPMQGDLHNPGAVEGVFFHQRKALSLHEKANIAKKAVHPYEGEVPPYKESLKKSLEELKEKLGRKDSEFNHKALTVISDLEKQYDAR
jgi:kinase-associated protein B